MKSTKKPLAVTSSETHYCSECGEAIYPGDWIWSDDGNIDLLCFCTPEHYRKSGV